MEEESAALGLIDVPYCKELYLLEWHGLRPFFLVLLVPPIGFLGFLLVRLRASLNKLSESDTLIMPTYYGFLWIAGVLGFLRPLVEFLQPEPVILYDILYLTFNFCFLFIHGSVVVFMSHENMVSGREALSRTTLITLLLAAAYSSIQIILLSAVGVRLYTFSKAASMYWMIITLAFSVVLGALLILPRFEALRDRFPARPALYQYVGFLFFLYFLRWFGSLLIFIDVDLGFCFIDLEQLVLFTLYAPLLYFFFMKDFFREVVLPQTYMEMSKSGYLDTDT